MIGPALDHVQKIFGKGFLIAAFFPSLLFVTVVSYLWVGFGPLKKIVDEWAQKGLKESTFEFVLVLVAVYLLAYVTYGTRAAAHQILQGDWPFPFYLLLGPVMRVFVRWKVRRKRRLLVRREEELNDPAWVIESEFGEASSPLQSSPVEARRQLERVRRVHGQLLRSLKRDNWTSRHDNRYLFVIRQARLLQANRGRLPIDLQRDISSLICNINDAYLDENHPELRRSVVRLNTLAEREWAAAYSDLYDNYPDDERWLRPTMLGNVAAVLELHPLNRYGINLSALWPRLIHVLTEDARARIEDSKIYLDFTVLMSLFSLVTIGVAIASDFLGPNRDTWLKILLPALALLASIAFYNLAIHANRAYAVQIEAAVDLFRLKLLDALEISRPQNMAEEKRKWEQLRYFIVQAETPEED